MAEARAVSSLGGYDEEFVDAVEEDFHCAICQLPLKEAVQTETCGHRFCRQCLDDHFKRLELNGRPLSCPVDRNSLIRDKGIFTDKATERKILSFIIRCPSKGCQWTGELRSKDNHLVSCPLKVVSCTNENCHVTLTKNKLKEHVTTCPWRILPCIHCNAAHPQCKTEVHQTECKRFPLKCPQSCGAFIPREEISTHTEKDCPLAIVFCPYAQMGCTTKIQRREVESHLETTTRLHLDLACVKLSYTQEITRKLEEKVNVLEKLMQCSEEQNFFKWKISGFSEVLTKAKSGEKTVICSEPFYRYGYKSRLRLYPNGFGIGKNTHLSVAINTMKGKHDDILPWPFHKKVTFMLIDQQEDANDRKNIVKSFIENPEDPEKKEYFARPVTNENRGYCILTFVPQNKPRERRYIVNDTIIIEVQVSPPK